MSRIFIGVDVCQDFLDAHARPTGARHRFPYIPDGVTQLLAWVQAFAPERVVLESTVIYDTGADDGSTTPVVPPQILSR